MDRQPLRLQAEPGDLRLLQPLPATSTANAIATSISTAGPGGLGMEHIGGGAAHVETDDRRVPARQLDGGHQAPAGPERIVSLAQSSSGAINPPLDCITRRRQCGPSSRCSRSR